MDVDQVVMILHVAAPEAEDAVVMVAVVGLDALALPERPVGLLPAPEEVNINVARGPVPGNGIVERKPIPLEDHHGESFLIVERRQFPQRALVGVVVLLRLQSEGEPIIFDFA